MPTEYLSVAAMVALAPELFTQGAYTPSEPSFKLEPAVFAAALAINSTDSASNA